MHLYLKGGLLTTIVLMVVGCTSSPAIPDKSHPNEIPVDQVEPLASNLTQDDEYKFGLDLVALEIRNKQFGRADRLLGKLKKYKPDDIRVYRLYTDYYEAKQDYAMAFVSSEQVLKKSGVNSKDEDRHAKYALMTDHYAEADKIYQHWLDDADSTSVEVIALNNLGFSALLQKHYRKAKDYFQKAINKDPLNEKARNNLKLIQTVEP
ncbi:tetratricopeptide repeat protein [Hydrogenovibrio kuenenii]|uniref:tetratricopeptide repeat protein n=1 Tax=Hydrogenovibrio kuenenii TaxID=63658 RepID=UPI000463546A|nr:tetratricopeptide repeat protein [Hydrogenovibrio kuenenii]